MKIGIRHEDKSTWEGRAPLVPADIKQLVNEHGIEFVIQNSPTRRIPAAEYAAAGATMVDTLDGCPLVMGVKEIPLELIEPKKTYVYFSHTIKGQAANMPALKRLMQLGCTLIDYERIVDEQGRRLVFFGEYAGLAGMIDTLWLLGRRLTQEGIATPFAQVTAAHEYADLADAERHIRALGDHIRASGLPDGHPPMVCGFAGYGNVSRGAQRVYDWLGGDELKPEELGSKPLSHGTCYKVVFQEKHIAAPKNPAATFNLQDYYEHPDRYQAAFFDHVPHLTLLMNCIYWDSRYPRLITQAQFQQLYSDGTQPRLRVIGDVSCDINGSLECTTSADGPGNPAYVYDPVTGATHYGVEGNGPVVLAVDFLPAELPIDSSRYFSQALRPFIPALANTDFSRPLEESDLPPELRRATIVYAGKLAPPFERLAKYVEAR
ncbi:MAG: hypothetical protein JXO22_03865 [Phycisphaerae bacterium]|nr:hypothetical protein [Phycisphaerae bacterium]